MKDDKRVSDQTTKENAPAEKEKKKLLSVLIEIVIYIVLAIMIVIVLPRYIFSRVSVDGISMEESLYDGDQLIGESISCYTGGINRYDIIFFHPYGRDEDEIYIKRVIGLPGESVQIIGTDVYINGVPISESFGSEEIEDSGRASEEVLLGEDEYFVMGDNRNHSTDSRFSAVQNVKLEDIDGVVVFRVWPLERFGFLK